MFKILSSNPIKKLEKEYAVLLEKAVNAQRSGDMALYAKLSAQAEEVGQKLDKLKK